MRESFEEHIKGLNEDAVAMGEMVATAISRSVEALSSQNIEKAKQIINDDLLVNKKRWQIEEKCINLIALQQPVATDLRDIIAVLNIVTELERMGDYAEGIAKITINRPEVHNAFRPLTVTELQDAFRQAHADDADGERLGRVARGATGSCRD